MAASTRATPSIARIFRANASIDDWSRVTSSVGTHTRSALDSRLPKFARMSLVGARASIAPTGTTRSSVSPNVTRKNGTASSTRTRLTPSAYGSGRFMTRSAWPRQNFPALSLGLKIRPFSTRGPSTASTAGSTTIDTRAASPTTATPANANERRYGIGNSTSAASEIITVPALNATVRPAVCIVRPTATSCVAPRPSSSR